MLATYAVILRRSALLTAPVALLMIGLGAVLGGTKGLLGASLGVTLVIAFFGISVLVVGRAAKISPQAMMVAAIATYLGKILVLLFLVGQFQDSTAFNPRLFGLTAIVCVLAYSAAQMIWSIRLKMLYVEPDRDR
jgi:ATP synthase protein I